MPDASKQLVTCANTPSPNAFDFTLKDWWTLSGCMSDKTANTLGGEVRHIGDAAFFWAEHYPREYYALLALVGVCFIAVLFAGNQRHKDKLEVKQEIGDLLPHRRKLWENPFRRPTPPAISTPPTEPPPSHPGRKA